MIKANWLGKVVLPDGGEAILKTDGKWESNDKDLELMLNASFALNDQYTLGLPTGWSTVSNAATFLKGRAVFPFKLQPLKEGEVS